MSSKFKTALLASFLLHLPEFSISNFESCLVREEVDSSDHYFGNPQATRYILRNCSDSSYCCDNGCCSILWYTGPLAIFGVIVFICCVTCVKACWDVYREGGYTTELPRVRYIPERVDRIRDRAESVEQTLASPPPSYSIAIYLPQPRDRIPSYEEVMNGT